MIYIILPAFSNLFYLSYSSTYLFINLTGLHILQMKYIIILLLLSACCICQQKSNAGYLSSYDLSGSKNKSFTLDKRLKEISGLAVNGNSKIFAHNDEEGIVYVIDPSKEKIIKEISFSRKPVKQDFEGIALVKDTLFLITSSGTLYKFKINNDDVYDYSVVETGLSSKYNVEGLCFNPAKNVLLIACKGFAGKGLKNYRAIYSFDLKTNKLKSKPEILISLKLLKSKYNINNFSPSGIAIHPVNGNCFILSSHEKAVIEVSTDGKVINGVKLKGKLHKQPEGIAFLPDNTLVISDEGKEKKAKLTFIPFGNK